MVGGYRTGRKKFSKVKDLTFMKEGGVDEMIEKFINKVRECIKTNRRRIRTVG